MTTSLDAILGQYEKNQSPNTEKKFVSNEERLKKYFAPFLPKGQTDGEKTVRILPTADGSSPFKEVYFHETQVQGKWMKIYDPGKNSDGSLSGERSPLNQQDKELARQYRSKKFYIVKVIDRENEDDGVKFWRFKHNWKGDGIMDKLIPLFQKRGDLTNLKEGRDVTLILKAVPLPSGNGTYTAVSMVMSEDPSVLHTDENTSKPWIANAEEWSDVYSQKPVEYLEAIAKGETPIWNNETKKYSYDSATEESIDMSQDSKTNVDPQANQSVDQDLPF